MSGFYKKAVVWLGLNEDYPEPEEADPRRVPRPEPSERQAATPASPSRNENRQGSQGRPSTVQTRESVTVKPVATPATGSTGTVRAVPVEPIATPGSSTTSSLAIGTVRAVPVPKTVKPKVIIPQSFNDAQLVADTFREPKPVIVNMQNAERDLARRLIDFSSGLCYGLGGQMEKVAKDVYLLTPDEVEVADEDRDAY